MNYGDLQVEVFRRVEEVSGSPAYFALDEVKSALNEGWEDLAFHTRWYRDVVRVPLQDVITYYDLRELPGQPILIERLWDVQTQRWLTPTTVEKLQRETYYRWEATEGTLRYWFVRGMFQLGIWPKRNYSTSNSETDPYMTDFVDIHMRAVPPPLEADDYTPPFSEEFQEALVHYACSELHSQEGETDLSIGHYNSYIELADKMKAWTRQVGERSVVRYAGRTVQ